MVESNTVCYGSDRNMLWCSHFDGDLGVDVSIAVKSCGVFVHNRGNLLFIPARRFTLVHHIVHTMLSSKLPLDQMQVDIVLTLEIRLVVSNLTRWL